MNYNDSLDIFNIFNRNGVEYLVVGGTAVSYYGERRRSTTASGEVVDKPDLDFWYNPNYPNYYNLLKALKELGRDVTRYENEQSPNPRKSVFKYDLDNYTLDLLPNIKAPLNFRESFARRTVVKLGDTEISFISLGDLIQDKQAMGRPKDLADIENLRRNNPLTIL